MPESYDYEDEVRYAKAMRYKITIKKFYLASRIRGRNNVDIVNNKNKSF